jgi:hypothetical protein
LKHCTLLEAPDAIWSIEALHTIWSTTHHLKHYTQFEALHPIWSTAHHLKHHIPVEALHTTWSTVHSTSVMLVSFLTVSPELWIEFHACGFYERVRWFGICCATYHKEGTDQERKSVKNIGTFCSQRSKQVFWCKNVIIYIFSCHIFFCILTFDCSG